MSYGSFRKRADFSNLERRPARMPVYSAGIEEESRGRESGRHAGGVPPGEGHLSTSDVQLTTTLSGSSSATTFGTMARNRLPSDDPSKSAHPLPLTANSADRKIAVEGESA